MSTTKRILVYVLGFIITCLLGFYLIGLIKPTVTYETTLTINRPVEQSWAVFCDEKLTKEWMKGFVKFEKIKGEPLTAGSEFNMHVEENGQPYIIREKVLNAEIHQLYEFVLENEVLTNHVVVTFKETAPFTTEISSSSKVEAKNWFLRSLFVFFKSQFKQNEEDNLNALKRLIEMDPVVKKSNPDS